MEEHLSERNNDRLVNLMTIARTHEGSEYDLDVMNELLYGSAMLLVPAKASEEMEEGEEGATMSIDAPSIDGVLTLYAFTGEAAVRSFATEEITCMGLPSSELLRICMQQGVGAILLDPDTPNELCVTLSPFRSGEN
ncbi:MAG TPA: SseB family protein [Flavobacteriales bacterium]|jgi:hypothetical protein|nr:SseB family protein [Flavobacteriales bacterium]